MANQTMNTEWKTADFIHLSIFSLGATGFLVSLGTVVLPVLVLDVAPEELKNTYLGLLSLAGLSVALVVQPVIGYASDRTVTPWGRRRPYMVVGTVLASVTVYGLGAATTIASLVIVVMIVQLCINSASGPYHALIRDIAPGARRGAASSFKILADTSGGIFSLVLLSVLLGRYEGGGSVVWLWSALSVSSIVLAVGAAWTVLAIRTRDISIPQGTGAAATPEVHRKAHPQFGWYLSSRFCIFAALSALQTYAVFFFRDVVGLDNPVGAVGLVALVAGGALLLATYPAGRWSDRVGRKRVIIAAVIVGAAGVMLLLPARSLTHVILASALIGASAGAYHTASWAMATDMVSQGRTGQQMGIANIATVLGSALAKAAGPGVDALNRVEDGLGYSTLMAACGAMLILGALLLTRVRMANPSRPAQGVGLQAT